MHIRVQLMLVLICTWLSAAAVAQQTQPRSGTAALAARVRELADAYVAEFTNRFPEQAVFNGLGARACLSFGPRFPPP